MIEKIIVPAYFDPASAPDLAARLVNAAVRLGSHLVVILNPSNGPGSAAVPAYTDLIRQLTDNGSLAIGYVATCFGDEECPRLNRTILDVDSDIKNWYSFYPALSGIFFDEMNSDPGFIGTYQAWYDVAQEAHRERAAYVAFNPGLPMDPGFFSISKALFVVYQGPAAAFFDAQEVATPRVGYHHRSAAMVYATTESDYADVVLQAQSELFGALYVTDDALEPNPWDTLPPYFEELVRTVEQSNTRVTRGSTEPGNTKWEQYKFGEKEIATDLHLIVDTSHAGFTRIPTYVISLAGTANHYRTTGGSEVYNPTKDGFEVFIHQVGPVTPEFANASNWHINWVACGL